MKTCPKCKMKLRDEDKICNYCGAPQMSDNSVMKNYEENRKKKEITPARRIDKIKEFYAFASSFIILAGFIVVIAFIIMIFFGPEFADMIKDIGRFFNNLISSINR